MIALFLPFRSALQRSAVQLGEIDNLPVIGMIADNKAPNTYESIIEASSTTIQSASSLSE